MASDKVDTDDLEESIRKRYARAGVAILADDTPKRLDPGILSDMESLTGADLSDVRIHTGERAGRMAESLGARAFAAGTDDVFFAQGEYAPSTSRGKALLAHELTHVAEGQGGLARRPRHPEREELEIRARRSEEMVLAEEQAPPQPAMAELLDPVEVEPPPSTDVDAGTPRGLPVDKVDLEDRIVEVIERETRRERDRTGRT